MQLSIPPDLAVKLSETRGLLAKLEREASDHILGQLGFVKGDVVEDQNSGLRYVIADANGYWDGARGASGYVTAHRLYKSGRREGKTARSSSHLSVHHLVKAAE